MKPDDLKGVRVQQFDDNIWTVWLGNVRLTSFPSVDGAEDCAEKIKRFVEVSRLSPEPSGRLDRDQLRSVLDFCDELAVADLDEIAADGGVTVGMVFQQQARTVYAPRLRAMLQASEGSKEASQGDGTAHVASATETEAQHSAGWVELIATEFAKPQFMTTTSGPSAAEGYRTYSVEFTFSGRSGEEAERARAARDALEDAFRAAGRAINGPAQ